MDKADVLRLIKAELDVKVLVAEQSDDAQLRAICEKIKRIQRETNETVMHRSLFGKDEQNPPRFHFSTDQLEKLHDDLKDHGTNSYNKIRELTKLLFKTEMDLLARKKTAMDALEKYKEGALDLAVQYACHYQYLKANGDMNWSKLEKDIDYEVKQRIGDDAYGQGQNDAMRD